MSVATQNETTPFARVPARTAAEVCAAYRPKEKVLVLLQEGLSPQQFFDRLVARGLRVEAAQFLASALPRREAVWWASAAVRRSYGAEVPPKLVPALAAAETWAAEPTEVNRRAAQQAAEAVGGAAAPAGCVAMAAAWSGSPTSACQQAVAPSAALTAGAALGAVVQAALMPNPLHFHANLDQLLALGVAVASGEHRWPHRPGPTKE